MSEEISDKLRNPRVQKTNILDWLFLRFSLHIELYHIFMRRVPSWTSFLTEPK